MRISLLLFPIAFIALVTVSCTSSPLLRDGAGVSDTEYISIASKNETARALLATFPQAEASVDQSGRLAVDFRVSKRSALERTGTGLRLRVFVDPATKETAETLIECDGTLVTRPANNFLQQFLESGNCR